MKQLSSNMPSALLRPPTENQSGGKKKKTKIKGMPKEDFQQQ